MTSASDEQNDAVKSTLPPQQEELQLVHARYRQLLQHKEQTATQLKSRLLEYREQQLRVKVALLSILEKRREIALRRERLQQQRQSNPEFPSFYPTQLLFDNLRKTTNLKQKCVPAYPSASIATPSSRFKYTHIKPPAAPPRIQSDSSIQDMMQKKQNKKSSCLTKWVQYDDDGESRVY